jgi:trans-aconitate methyltransferase
MSKYRDRGAYHFAEFANPGTAYAMHIDDLIRRLGEHIGEGIKTTAFEVGCGEGLILNQLTLRLGWRVAGSDVDPYAVDMARRLCPHAVVHLIDVPPPDLVDVALFCDSLEHVEDPLKMIAWGKKAKWIVVAIPSVKDRHATHEITNDALEPYLSEWGAPVHRATRHARHLTIWKRHA